jgi:hypothetical protein
VLAIQRALGLERRPAGAALRVVSALETIEQPDSFAPAPAV